MQEECRERCSSKLSETLKCKAFRFPTLLSAEQATSDALAALHADLIGRDDAVLDMTCGLGIDAFHIARVCKTVTAIDIDCSVAEAARHNVSALGLTNIEILCADSVEWLKLNDRHFDVIFIDPARRAADGGRIFALSQCHPDVVSILPLLRERASKVIIKASPMLDVSRTLSELGGDADIIIYGAFGECKELTAIIPGSGIISVGDFSFSIDQERRATVKFADINELNGFLYEPSASIMKAGSFKLLSERFKISKLDRNTHLYCADNLVDNFPGRRMKITAVYRMSNKSVRELSGIEADVAVRNFPMSAEALRKKLKIKRGGDGNIRLYGTTVSGEKMLILTESLPECPGD